MPDSSPVIHRAQKRRAKRLQNGIVLSVTTLAHPLSKFGNRPRTIALIELEDNTRVMGALSKPCAIGEAVRPRMTLSSVNEEGLRVYDVNYEPIALKPVLEPEFHGYMLALTGPSGVGKSTVSKLLVHAFASIVSPVPIITTRKRKKGDDGEYRYVSARVFDEMIKNNELAAWTDIPAGEEDRRYAYAKSDMEKIWKSGNLPVVITEMHLLQGLAKTYGRRSILSFGLLPPGKSKRAMLSALLHRLRERGRETEEQMAHRIKNAEKDLAFFTERKDLFDHLLVNEDLDAMLKMVKERVPGLREA
jgi:guanylate kinase